MSASDRFASDLQFHELYPTEMRVQANMHWTPLHIARQAADFLAAEEGSRVLDIGSGAGKFCLAAAYYRPKSWFTGVEQRANLVQAAESAGTQLVIPNVNFIHSNITAVDFTDFDHFYFFNSFFENIEEAYRIDDGVTYSRDLFRAYNGYVYRQLAKKPAGTRLATFHSTEEERPPSFHEVGGSADGALRFWIRI